MVNDGEGEVNEGNVRKKEGGIGNRRNIKNGFGEIDKIEKKEKINVKEIWLLNVIVGCGVEIERVVIEIERRKKLIEKGRKKIDKLNEGWRIIKREKRINKEMIVGMRFKIWENGEIGIEINNEKVIEIEDGWNECIGEKLRNESRVDDEIDERVGEDKVVIVSKGNIERLDGEGNWGLGSG